MTRREALKTTFMAAVLAALSTKSLPEMFGSGSMLIIHMDTKLLIPGDVIVLENGSKWMISCDKEKQWTAMNMKSYAKIIIKHRVEDPNAVVIGSAFREKMKIN